NDDIVDGPAQQFRIHHFIRIKSRDVDLDACFFFKIVDDIIGNVLSREKYVKLSFFFSALGTAGGKQKQHHQ
ncbi:MAG: hypothetical protein IJI77_03080, partial [Erysipelotrichaceae bacterium]|nr:hypothetical protein [Erysipelotrichaceae bacterium]